MGPRLAAAGSLPASRVTLLERAAQAARFAGEARTAIALCEEALARLDQQADAVHAALLFERLGDYHFWDDATALECYRRALRLLPDAAEPERARLRAAEGHALMGMRRWEESRACCEDALRRRPRRARRGRARRAEHARPRARLPRRPRRRGAALPAGAGCRRAPGAAKTAVRAHLQLGELRRLRGDHAGALEVMVRGEAAAARLGMRSSFGNFMHANGADDLLRLGRWDEVAARLEEAASARPRLDHRRAAPHGRGASACPPGRVDAARAQLACRRLMREGLPSEFGTPLRAAWAVLCLIAGEAEEAARHVAEALAALGETKEPALHAGPVRPRRARRGRAGRARPRPAADAISDAAIERARGLTADLDRCSGSGAAARRRPARRERRAGARRAQPRRGRQRPATLGGGRAAWEALAEPHAAAYARLRLAEALLLAGGDRAAAGRELAAAHSAAARLGAAPLRAEAEMLARRARVSLEAPTPPPAARAATAHADQLGLTSREAEVLCLLAEGLTNREIATRLFISQKTVASHLAHIFDKLAVHSRVEAAGRAHQLGLVEGRS